MPLQPINFKICRSLGKNVCFCTNLLAEQARIYSLLISTCTFLEKLGILSSTALDKLPREMEQKGATDNLYILNRVIRTNQFFEASLALYTPSFFAIVTKRISLVSF